MKRFSFSLVGLLAATGGANAANITMATGGDYNTGANWGGGVVPGAGDIAIIRAGDTATHSAGTTVNQSLRLGLSNGTETGTLDVNGGSMTFNTGDPYRDSSGTLNVNGGTVLQSGGNTRMAHRNGSTDVINVNSGAFTNTSRVSGENGAWSLNVNGGTATYNGSHFDAAVNPDSGGDIDNDQFAIGLTGGTLTFDLNAGNAVRLGTRAGSTSIITQSGGTFETLSTMSAPRVELTGTATSTTLWGISGGTIDIADSFLGGAGAAGITVMGSSPVINIGNDFNFSSAASTVRFEMDAMGVSTINANDVFISGGTALEVVVNDTSGMPGPLGFGSVGSVDLFNFAASQSGIFGTESIIYNGRLLSPGADPMGAAASLGADEYFVDYDNAGNVSLFFHVVPEPSRAMLLLLGISSAFLRRRR